MINSTEQPTPVTETPSIPTLGSRLQTAREALGLDRKDAAAQLRLQEKMIIMMENDTYPSDLPTTFVRGYLRAYGKLLQIPEAEVLKALEPIKQKPMQDDIAAAAIIEKQNAPITSSNYYMQIMTYLIVFTLIGLMTIWWYSHRSPTNTPTTTSDVQLNTVSDDSGSSNNMPIAPPTDTSAKPTPQPVKSAQPAPTSSDSHANEAAGIKHEVYKVLSVIKSKSFMRPAIISKTLLPLTGPSHTVRFFTNLILLALIGFFATWRYHRNQNLPTPQSSEVPDTKSDETKTDSIPITHLAMLATATKAKPKDKVKENMPMNLEFPALSDNNASSTSTGKNAQ